MQGVLRKRVFHVQAKERRNALTRFLLPAGAVSSLLQAPRQKLRQPLALGV